MAIRYLPFEDRIGRRNNTLQFRGHQRNWNGVRFGPASPSKGAGLWTAASVRQHARQQTHFVALC